MAMAMAAGQYRYANLKVSHGGKFQRSLQCGRPRYTYVGGETKMVKVPRSISLREFHDRLAAMAGWFKVAIWYVRPHESLDTLHEIVTDGELHELLNWVLLRDLQIHLPGPNNKDAVSLVWVFAVRVNARPPLPESLFSSAPTTTMTPPLPPSCLINRRTASAPSLSANSPDDTSEPPSPTVIRRSASASTLTQPSTEADTTASITTAAAAAQGHIVHGAAPYLALHRGPVGPAPVFLVPVVPVVVYRPVIPVYHGFLVPAGPVSPRGSAGRRLN